MFVWELLSCRLRGEGWNIWHTTEHDSRGPIYRVHLERLGTACTVSGPTLTEAYAAAARRARSDAGPAHSANVFGFARSAGATLLGV